MEKGRGGKTAVSLAASPLFRYSPPHGPSLHRRIAPTTGKGGILRLLIEVGQLPKQHIGKITLSGGLATIETGNGRSARLAHLLDGHLLETRHIRAWSQADGESQPHFAQLRRWLELEAEAERQQFQTAPQTQAEHTLTRLVIRGEDVGLGGRILLQLAPRNEQTGLPFSRLSTGSPIMLIEEGESQPQSSPDGGQSDAGSPSSSSSSISASTARSSAYASSGTSQETTGPRAKGLMGSNRLSIVKSTAR